MDWLRKVIPGVITAAGFLAPFLFMPLTQWGNAFAIVIIFGCIFGGVILGAMANSYLAKH